MIIVEHVGGQGPFDLVTVGIFDDLLFGLLLLLLLQLGLRRASRHASSSCDSLLMLIRGLIFVSAA